MTAYTFMKVNNTDKLNNSNAGFDSTNSNCETGTLSAAALLTARLAMVKRGGVLVVTPSRLLAPHDFNSDVFKYFEDTLKTFVYEELECLSPKI